MKRTPRWTSRRASAALSPFWGRCWRLGCSAVAAVLVSFGYRQTSFRLIGARSRRVRTAPGGSYVLGGCI